MKIDKKNSPLAILDRYNEFKSNLEETYITDGKVISIDHDIKMFLREKNKELKGNIKIYTIPFWEAYQKSEEKITEVIYKNKIKNEGDFCGVFVFKETIKFYSFSCKMNGDVCQFKNIGYLHFVNNKIVEFFFNDELRNFQTHYCDKLLQKARKDYNYEFVNEIQLINELCIFETVCDLEIKKLPPGKSEFAFGCKYNNQTNNNIKILSSTYFTTLVKSDAFKVRGHFRLQPCGEGMKERRLIWINEFEKHGYVREADKIKLNLFNELKDIN